ncbi:phage antirepressor protein [Acinetobacter cumulans]|uniref:Phage antirepressor protein n=1 Tax=Acinetobacter cumulans TaxID=2136182 RepID=A0A498CVV9_9GAMM|nr:phage antirepressor KilAC domain-containing protein [Acinetobacter cumulans]RLL29052.1 phage antirepressor protein [Acinetobacter cumulans]
MNMPILPQFGSSEQSMTSLEIAELVEKRHDNVKRTIENLVNANIISHPQIEDGIKSANGVIPKVYVFTGEKGKRDSIIVVAQLCPEFTARLVDRWQELEAQAYQPQKPTELSRMDLIQLALQAEQENIELRGQVAILEPKAKGLDRIADCTNVLGIREAAKVLKVGQNQLTQYLLDHKVVYRDNFSKIQAYQKSIDQKLVHVVTSAPRLFESGEKVFTQVKLTQKLITRIAKWLEKEVAA